MDWNRIEGNWKEAKGKIKQKWGQLTDDDLASAINWRERSSRAAAWPRIWCVKTSTTGWTLNRNRRTQMLQDQEQDQVNVVSSSEDPEPRPVIPARQARQGVTGHNVRLVLGFSLAAIVILFAIIWIVYFA